MDVMEPAPSELATRRVVRDGSLVATLRVLVHAGATKVVAEVFTDGPDGPQSTGIRPYTFDDRREADAFVDDAIGTFTYLGCEIQPGT